MFHWLRRLFDWLLSEYRWFIRLGVPTYKSPVQGAASILLSQLLASREAARSKVKRTKEEERAFFHVLGVICAIRSRDVRRLNKFRMSWQEEEEEKPYDG